MRVRVRVGAGTGVGVGAGVGVGVGEGVGPGVGVGVRGAGGGPLLMNACAIRSFSQGLDPRQKAQVHHQGLLEVVKDAPFRPCKGLKTLYSEKNAGTSRQLVAQPPDPEFRPNKLLA